MQTSLHEDYYYYFAPSVCLFVCLFVCLLLLLFAAVVVMGEGWEEYKRLVSFCHKSM